MTPPTPFIPKQALPFDGALLEELQGSVTESIATFITTLLPPLLPAQKIHDNGCGYGAVTAALLATNTPPDIEITATDKNQVHLKFLEAKVATEGWPVKTAIVNANSLTFPDETFDISISDFVIRGLDNEVGALAHVWRTLKPGGTAAVALWKEKPWLLAMERAHYTIRGSSSPLPPAIALTDWTPEEFKQKVEEAGWKGTEFVEKDAFAVTKDLRRWAEIAWSFLLRPGKGWTEMDEERWDEAVDVLVRELENSEGYSLEGGEHRLKMTAIIAVASKE